MFLIKTKLVDRFILILVIAFSYLCSCTSLRNISTNSSPEQAPILRFEIKIDANRRDELFIKLQEFAGTNNFEYKLSFYNKEAFLVEMMREDIEILAVDMPESPNTIKIKLYKTNPSNQIPENMVDEITKELILVIDKIPNIEIGEVISE